MTEPEKEPTPADEATGESSGTAAESATPPGPAPQLDPAQNAEAAPAQPIPAEAQADVPEAAKLLVPDAPRMPAPAFASRTIPDPSLSPPSGMFLAIVSITSLVADVATKLWAEAKLETYPGVVDVIEGNLQFVLAKNKGGAWGLLQGAHENLRRPFFLLVSVAAISFIVTLYRRLNPRQQALKWGLPLVLGGALGNVFDRVRYGHVIDFIDYRADWVKKLNELVAKYVKGHYVTDHWPTFNVADIAICVGVILMAIDMFTSRRGKLPTVMVADVPLQNVHLAEDGGVDVDRQPEGVGDDGKQPGHVVT